DLRDVFAGIFVSDDDQAAGLGINGDDGVADAVVGIGLGVAACARSGRAAETAAREAATGELGLKWNGDAEQKGQDGEDAAAAPGETPAATVSARRRGKHRSAAFAPLQRPYSVSTSVCFTM